jgi:hypothetical protein
MSHPRRTLAQRAALVQQWRASGLSALAFARRHGFAPQNLPRWAARLDTSSPAPASAALTFVRLETAPRALLVVEVGAARVRVEPGFDPALLRAVVVALSDRTAS